MMAVYESVPPPKKNKNKTPKPFPLSFKSVKVQVYHIVKSCPYRSIFVRTFLFLNQCSQIWHYYVLRFYIHTKVEFRRLAVNFFPENYSQIISKLILHLNIIIYSGDLIQNYFKSNMHLLLLLLFVLNLKWSCIGYTAVGIVRFSYKAIHVFV